MHCFIKSTTIIRLQNLLFTLYVPSTLYLFQWITIFRFNNSPYLFLWLHVFIEITCFICFEYYITCMLNTQYFRGPLLQASKSELLIHPVWHNLSVLYRCTRSGPVTELALLAATYSLQVTAELGLARLPELRTEGCAMLCFLFCRFHSPAPALASQQQLQGLAKGPQPELMISSRL